MTIVSPPPADLLTAPLRFVGTADLVERPKRTIDVAEFEPRPIRRGAARTIGQERGGDEGIVVRAEPGRGFGHHDAAAPRVETGGFVKQRRASWTALLREDHGHVSGADDGAAPHVNRHL